MHEANSVAADQKAGQPSMALGTVGLIVADRPRVAAFYEQLGLQRLADADGALILGAGAEPLVALREAKGASRDPREAGLFHLALRVPDRPALAAILRHLVETGVVLDGLSDHRVSEAIYLRDPEGNGVEIYADRPRDLWYENGVLAMATHRLDVQGLMAATGQPHAAPLPVGTDMGHVHLESLDPESTRAFYGEQLGMALMSRYPQAVFLSRDGYHHHLAGNGWNGRSLPRAAAQDTQGVDYITLRVAEPLQAGFNEREIVDPSGVRVRLTGL